MKALAILLVVLLFLNSFIAAQSNLPAAKTGPRTYIAGKFTKLQSWRKSGVSCFDKTTQRWSQETNALKSTLEPAYEGAGIVRELLDQNEMYFFNPLTRTIQYINGTHTAHVRGDNGVFKFRAQSTDPYTFGSVSNILVNKERTRMWVIGRFTRFGDTDVAALSPAANANANRILCLTLVDPVNVVVNPITTSVSGALDISANAPLFTQRTTLFARINMQGGTNMLFRIEPGTWTALSDSNQGNFVSSARFKQGNDEAVWAHHTNGILSAAPQSQVTIQRLGVGETTWTNVHTVSDIAQPTEAIHPTLWTVANQTLFYVHVNSVPGGDTKSLADAAATFNQYIYKKEAAGRAILNKSARLVSQYPTFDSMSNLITSLEYDQNTDKVIAFGPNIGFLVMGEFQSRFLDANMHIDEDKRKYRVIRVSNTVAIDPFTGEITNAYGGGIVDNKISMLKNARSSCFVGARTASVFSPYIAMYDASSDSWSNIPDLVLDEDPVYSTVTEIKAIARIPNTDNFYFGGSFAGANGIALNSIGFYSTTKGVSSLGGVSQYAVEGNTGSLIESDLTRYMGARPGVVNALAYDTANGGQLYVQGSFFAAGNISQPGYGIVNFARYSESLRAWFPMDGGLNGVTTKLVTLNGNLYAIGSFSYAGSIPVRNIAMFNLQTQKWEPLGYGLQAAPKDIIAYRGNIYIMVTDGSAVNANSQGLKSSNVWMWNPSSKTWSIVNLKLEKALQDSNTCSNDIVSCSITFGDAAYFTIFNDRLSIVTSTGIWVLQDNYFVRLTASFWDANTVPLLANKPRQGDKHTILFKENALQQVVMGDSATLRHNAAIDRDTFFADNVVTILSGASTMGFNVMMLAITLVMTFLFL